MKRVWIKLYVEMLDDPKIGTLAPWLRWRFVELLLVAAEGDGTGTLPPVTQLAWRLRVDKDDLLKSLRAMREIGVVCEQGDHWKVTSFEKRQFSESYERVKRFKERERNAKSNATGNAVVTEKESSSSSSSNSSSDSFLDEGGGAGEGTAAAVADFEDNSARDAERLYTQITGQVTFPPAWDHKYIASLATVLYDHFERDVEKAAQSGKPVFARYCKTRGRNGREYSRTGSGWVDWWLAELAPKPAEPKQSDGPDVEALRARARKEILGANAG